MGPEEVIALLRLIGRLERERDTWEQRARQLKEELNELRAGSVVHSNERETNKPSGSSPNGGS